MASLFQVPEVVGIIAQCLRLPRLTNDWEHYNDIKALHNVLLVNKTCFYEASRVLYRNPGSFARTHALLLSLVPQSPRTVWYQSAIKYLYILTPGPDIDLVRRKFRGQVTGLALLASEILVKQRSHVQKVGLEVARLVNILKPEKIRLANAVWPVPRDVYCFEALGITMSNRFCPSLRELKIRFEGSFLEMMYTEAGPQALTKILQTSPQLSAVILYEAQISCCSTWSYIHEMGVGERVLTAVKQLWTTLLQKRLDRFEFYGCLFHTAINYFNRQVTDHVRCTALNDATCNWRHVNGQHITAHDALWLFVICGNSSMVEVIEVTYLSDSISCHRDAIAVPLVCFRSVGGQLRELRIHTSTFVASATGIGEFRRCVPNLHTFVFTSARDDGQRYYEPAVYGNKDKVFIYDSDIEQFSNAVPMLRVFELYVSFTVITHRSLIALGTNCRNLNALGLGMPNSNKPNRWTMEMFAELRLNTLYSPSDLRDLRSAGEKLDITLFPNIQQFGPSHVLRRRQMNKFRRKHFPQLKV